MFKNKKLYAKTSFKENDFSFELNTKLEFTNIKWQNKPLIKRIYFSDYFKENVKKQILNTLLNPNIDYLESLMKKPTFDIQYKKNSNKLEFFANCKLKGENGFLNIHFNIHFVKNEIIIENINTSSTKILWGLKSIVIFEDNVDIKENNPKNLLNKKNIKSLQNSSKAINNQINYQSSFSEIVCQKNQLVFQPSTFCINKKNIKKWFVKPNNKNYNTTYLQVT